MSLDSRPLRGFMSQAQIFSEYWRMMTGVCTQQNWWPTQFPHRDTSNDFKDQTLEIHNLSEKALKKFATTPATRGPRGPEERTVLL